MNHSICVDDYIDSLDPLEININVPTVRNSIKYEITSDKTPYGAICFGNDPIDAERKGRLFHNIPDDMTATIRRVSEGLIGVSRIGSRNNQKVNGNYNQAIHP